MPSSKISQGTPPLDVELDGLPQSTIKPPISNRDPFTQGLYTEFRSDNSQFLSFFLFKISESNKNILLKHDALINSIEETLSAVIGLSESLSRIVSARKAFNIHSDVEDMFSLLVLSEDLLGLIQELPKATQIKLDTEIKLIASYSRAIKDFFIARQRIALEAEVQNQPEKSLFTIPSVSTAIEDFVNKTSLRVVTDK